MRTKLKRLAAVLLSAALLAGALGTGAWAKTSAMGQTVDTVLFYLTNSQGEEILVSQIPVSELEGDLAAGQLDDTVHNYSLLDRYVTTVHQEAQGMTVEEFVSYAQSKSTLAALRDLPLTFAGRDSVSFWEIDQTGFDELDTYTYDQLYGVARYNFPLLYQYWNYRTQDYYDPAGAMTRDQVIDYIFSHGEPETFLLSVRAFSQRYMVTADKYDTGDYNMENAWSDQGLLDNERTIRLMFPMTKDELYNKTSTASNGRYWVANIRLDMAQAPRISSAGTVVAPTAVMTEDGENYYIRFSCDTQGASIYYNQNFISPSYTPTARYDGGVVTVPKSYFPDGTVTMTARAVKEGCTDAGVVTLTLTASGTQAGWTNPFTDVSAGDWYYRAVQNAVERGYYAGTSATTFSPDGTMTRGMFVTVLSNVTGTDTSGYTAGKFSDVAPSDWYATRVNWAASIGLVAGTGDGKFSPNRAITLEQMLLVLYNLDGAKASTADLPGNVGAISSWAQNALRWANEKGLLDGVGGTLSAQGSANRAQVAQILLNYTGA